MLLYSVKLTFWALIVVPLFITLTLIIAPIIKDQLRDKTLASAAVNSHLLQALNGMETVRGQSLELPIEWRWEKLYKLQIKKGFKNILTSSFASSAGQLLQQLSNILIIWMGILCQRRNNF